ncbi:MAG: hypothetical protein CMM52_04875 [Rhodospirillaceae bacterium]|nr:hypothetical protein [Rhodospirillaceae bacterium]|tara:strand:- start:5160 stop:5582 length:423 start_codon:yes stop_codon:yes gene_type:complete
MSSQRDFNSDVVKTVQVDISPGELIDKITILEIKKQQIFDEQKLSNIQRELETLRAVCGAVIPKSSEMDRLTDDLKAVNLELWTIEDEIRERERDLDFGKRFIACARSVYKTNDRRAALKAEINDLLGAAIKEEKSYTPY